jgi:hypothetical protein
VTITLRTTPRRILAALPAAALAAALLGGCSADDGAGAGSASPAASSAEATPSATATESPEASASAEAEAPELSYPGEAGRTALELLLEADPSATVEGEGQNAFVTGIGGVEAGENEFWALYVDGEQAQVGAGSLVTEDGQEITWKLEAFE